MRRAERRSRAHLDQVGVPGISTDAQVIVAELLPRRLAEDVSCGLRKAATSVLGSSRGGRAGGRATDDISTLARSGRPWRGVLYCSGPFEGEETNGRGTEVIINAGK